MNDGPEFRHLISFLAVAEKCNFSAAAQKLHVSQPSLSARIKQLETDVSATLFNRTPAGTTLTVAGKALLAAAEKLVWLRADAIRDVSAAQAGTDVPVRFGYSLFIHHDLVRKLLKGLAESVPHGRIESFSECSAELVEMVLNGRLDVALVTLPVATKGLAITAVSTERLIVCLRADDPLAKEELLPRDAVQRKLTILFAPVHHPLLYEHLLQKFEKAGIALGVTNLVSSPAEMQFLIKMNIGFGLVRRACPLIRN